MDGTDNGANGNGDAGGQGGDNGATGTGGNEAGGYLDSGTFDVSTGLDATQDVSTTSGFATTAHDVSVLGGLAAISAVAVATTDPVAAAAVIGGTIASSQEAQDAIGHAAQDISTVGSDPAVANAGIAGLNAMDVSQAVSAFDAAPDVGSGGAVWIPDGTGGFMIAPVYVDNWSYGGGT
jgi:hypothetical protein